MSKTPYDSLLPLKAVLRSLDPSIERELFHCPENDEFRRVVFCMFVREHYQDKWGWGANAKYLYRALIRALGLQRREDELMRLAESKRGRKEERDLAARIWSLKAEGKTAPQMKAIFESEGKYFSLEKIESYLKTRRKKLKA
jgi:hypothetical protein